MAKRALFTINNRINLKTVYIVFKVKKILEGNLTDDRYANSDKLKGSLNKKILAKKNKDEEIVKDICKRLPNYRQPLAYCAMPLFEDKNLISNKNSFYYNEGEEELKLDQLDQENTPKKENSEGNDSPENSNESVNTNKTTPSIIDKLNKYSRDYTVNTFVKINDSKMLDEDLCTLIINEKNKKQKYISNLTINITLTKIENESLIPVKIDSSLFPKENSEKTKNTEKGSKEKINEEDNSSNGEKSSEEETSEDKTNDETNGNNKSNDDEENKKHEELQNQDKTETNNEPIKINQEPVLEIQEFLPEKYQLISTFSNFVNNIYVYPQLLNLTKSELKGRNIACKVMMFDGTLHSNQAEPLNV